MIISSKENATSFQEYNKNIAGGFTEEQLQTVLQEIGFREIDISYHWFIGQRSLIHDKDYLPHERSKYAEVMTKYLGKTWPLSRHLFKYLRIVAEK